jgi:hypothetical protein
MWQRPELSSLDRHRKTPTHEAILARAALARPQSPPIGVTSRFIACLEKSWRAMRPRDVTSSLTAVRAADGTLSPRP